MGEGPLRVTELSQTTNTRGLVSRSQTARAKLRRREGNSPDRQLRSPSQAKWGRMSVRPDNQEVGLEAAILERVRNSSLVQGTGADNVTGLSLTPTLRMASAMVGERRPASEARA